MPSLQRYRVDPDAEKKKKKKKMRPLRSRGRIMIALVCLAFMFVFSFGTGTEYLSGFTEQTLCQCNCPSEGPPAAENNNNNNNCSSSFFSSIFINNPLKSSSKDTTLVTLESEKYFMKNNLDLNFRTQVQVWQDVGKICVNITLAAANENDEAATCPYPYFRARLSGVAIVDIPLQRESKSGCALFPVAGRYHLDVALLHCTMNAWPTTVSSGLLRTLCPVLPKPRENAETYHIHVLPFERNENVVSDVWPQRNPFSRRAFVYSPHPCPDGQQDCSSNSNNDQSVPPIVRFDSQNPNDGSHNNEPKSLRFRDYSYVEVDPYKGAVVNNNSSKAVHFASNDTVCFVGDDHAQVLAHQTKLLYTNQENVDQPGCDGDQHVTEDGQFRFFFLKFARDSLNDSRFSNTELFGDCNLVLIHQGNFDAGQRSNRPTAPVAFASLTKDLVAKMRAITEDSAWIVVASTDPVPLSNRVASCKDWALPTLVDVYNAYLRGMTVEGNVPGERRFDGLPHAYYLDNTDIMDPVWDGAADYNLPCQHGFRPMAYRILSMMKQTSTGKPLYIP